ncbi:hypothetical protein NLI92_002843 [Priestia megaterium]|uniref:hypothetical protein n=1 Tax=Priestia megaterium TaxID=1404 RepID=UPI0021AC376F|nr:hypothetical protein [Priestia megaterium]MCR8927459.1 hypothetical protein [Priestia megaterium]
MTKRVNSDFISQNPSSAANIINEANDYREKINSIGAQNIKTSMEKLVNLEFAHRIALSVIWSIVKKSSKPGKSNESISDRLTLIASFIQGIEITEGAINKGLYPQAATLLKQELETLAAIDEVKRGKRKDGVTPKVKFGNVSWNLNIQYGPLNELAHVSVRDILNVLYNGKFDDVIGDAIPVSVLPIYNQEASLRLYTLHVSFLIQLIGLMNELHLEQYGISYLFEEEQMTMDAIGILEREGLIKKLRKKETDK